MASHPAIVGIPVYKSALTELETFSLQRCVDVLGDHPLTLIGPRSLDFSPYRAVAPMATVTAFDDRFFVSLEGYSEMLLTAAFYDAFIAFEHLLIHQLDAFVFEDRLAMWCTKPYDYIGAPWLGPDGRFRGVGNGGFSLRRVSACLGVLHATTRLDANVLWTHVRANTPNPARRALKYHRKLLAHAGLRNDLPSFLRRFIRRGEPEDMFWGLHAQRFCPGFRVASEDEALRFSIEDGLDEAWPHLNGSPPFGCHRLRYLEALRRQACGEPLETDFERRVCALGDAAERAAAH